MAAIILWAGAGDFAGARAMNAPQLKAPYSPVPGRVRRAGLWDKPNEACMARCKTHEQKGCFKRLAEEDPDADPGSIQERCDDTYSLCLYDCMCDTCAEDQIIIRP